MIYLERLDTYVRGVTKKSVTGFLSSDCTHSCEQLNVYTFYTFLSFYFVKSLSVYSFLSMQVHSSVHS